MQEIYIILGFYHIRDFGNTIFDRLFTLNNPVTIAYCRINKDSKIVVGSDKYFDN